MTATLLLRNVRPYAGAASDILIENGRIGRIAPGLDAPAGAVVEDGQGEIALPGFVEAHTHLDKTMWGCPGTGTRSARISSTGSTMSA
ncbi:MAG: hypothetical protein JO107_15085 [Hyphomicrobiales bacterium]|nr:hypothetical protein [Hyphomicrobiales bacterium]MBV8664416.1 hypothetical protein [Hyphomicrobiales bacterium]